MVKIHWSVYLILGGAVLFISNKLDPAKFKLFIWLGYLFLVIGIAKLGISFINKKKESPVERKEMKNFAYQQQGKQQPQQQSQQQQRAAMYCPRCRTPLQGYDNFCSRCGQRVR